MSNIDEILKEGLDGKGLEYTDAHWASMEKLLSANKVGFFAKNKWYITIIGSLLLAGLIGYYFGISTNSSPGKIANETSINTPIESSPDTKSEMVVFEEIEDELDTREESSQSTKIESQNAAAVANVKSSIESATAFQAEQSKVDHSSVLTKSEGDNENPRIVTQETSTPSFEAGTPSMVPSIIDKSTPSVESTSYSKKEYFKSMLESKTDFNFVLIGNIVRDGTGEYFGKATTGMSGKKLARKTAPWFYSFSPYVERQFYTGRISENLPNIFKGQEAPQNSNGYGFDLGFGKGNWSIKSGVGFVQLVENTNYKSTNNVYQYDTSYHINNKSYTQDSRGNNIALIERVITDSLVGSIDVVECVDCKMKLNYVRVPIAFQYELGTRRFGAFGDVGMSMSLLTKASGLYSFPTEDSIGINSFEIKDVSDETLINKTLLQANAGIGVKYHITSRLNAWTRFGYAYSLNSVLNPYAQRPKVSNIRLGIEYQIR